MLIWDTTSMLLMRVGRRRYLLTQLHFCHMIFHPKQLPAAFSTQAYRAVAEAELAILNWQHGSSVILKMAHR